MLPYAPTQNIKFTSKTQTLSNNIKVRYANNFSFAKIPFYDENKKYDDKIDIAIVGIPFDSGCSYRCGARFGPSSIRTNSCILREYNMKIDTYPFKKNIIDFADINVSPFNNEEAVKIMENELNNILNKSDKYIILGVSFFGCFFCIGGIVICLYFDGYFGRFNSNFTHIKL